MSRTIKFRAWNKPTRTMKYWGFFTDIFDKGAADRRNFETEHNEWMQFTGLLDKNGKEIYEGDILRKNTATFLVDWDNMISGVLWSNTDKCEVIGNIYENKYLLV